MEFVSNALIALHQRLNTRLSGRQRISADKPPFLARLADGSDLIALIYHIRKDLIPFTAGGRERVSMHLGLPTPTLLASLPHLLAPPPVGKVTVRNDLVGVSVAIALSLQAIFGVIHVSFITHREGRRCISNTAHFTRDGLSCKSTRWKQRAWRGYLIGDPHVPGDDTLAAAETWHVTRSGYAAAISPPLFLFYLIHSGYSR
jgi:hypothetical protein